MHLSEDDIRTKVVYDWLRDCGFSKKEISIEYSFTLQLPNREKSIHSRSDILVRSLDGKNLLIIEVKKPDHSLNADDKIQALAYACLLKNGIAPFTILTNGTETHIYDSVTKERINNSHVLADHPYVSSGFKPTGNGLKARMEALESLISLSENNLIEFCESQIENRIGRLKSDDIFSGKKYIPSLYVERNRSSKELKKKLFNKDNPRNILLVVGPPQHGKTCFMCHTVEEFLADGHPVLFYPAITLDGGLIQAIKKDFGWAFSEEMPEYHWVRRLSNIGKSLKKQIYIFVDGWNEMANHAFKINQECHRLNLNNITIVLSTTSPSLPRLLNDEAANPSYIQEKVHLNEHLIEKLKSEPLKDISKLEIVQIGKFEKEEINKARNTYSKAFKIENLPTGEIFRDPYYLRIACEMFKGNEIPSDITGSELIEKTLINKGKRRSIDEVSLKNGLSDLAKAFFSFGRPLSVFNLPQNFKRQEVLNPWLESGILSLIRGKDGTIVDFYYTHELDYSISDLYKNWKMLFETSGNEKIISELKKATKNQAGSDALIWFFKCKENFSVLKKVAEVMEENSFSNPLIDSIISDAIYTIATLYESLNFSWGEKWLEIIVENDEDYTHHIIAKLIYLFLISINEDSQVDKYKYWMRLLLKYDDSDEGMSMYESYISKIYGEDFIGYSLSEEDAVLDVGLFRRLILDEDEEIASRAAKYYAFDCRNSFLEKFPQLKAQLSNKDRDFKHILEESCKQVEHDLREEYYGSMCKGWLLHAEKGDKQVYDEYFKMKALLTPIIQVFPHLSFSKILDDLKKIAGVQKDIEDDFAINDPNQISLDFRQ